MLILYFWFYIVYSYTGCYSISKHIFTSPWSPLPAQGIFSAFSTKYVCTPVFSRPSVVPIALTVLLGKMYLLLALCIVPILLCLHLTAAFSPWSYRQPFTHHKLMVSIFTAFILHLLESKRRKCKTMKESLATICNFLRVCIFFIDSKWKND